MSSRRIRLPAQHKSVGSLETAGKLSECTAGLSIARSKDPLGLGGKLERIRLKLKENKRKKKDLMRTLRSKTIYPGSQGFYNFKIERFSIDHPN